MALDFTAPLKTTSLKVPLSTDTKNSPVSSDTRSTGRKVFDFVSNVGKEIIRAPIRAALTPLATTYQDTLSLMGRERPEEVNIPLIGNIGISATNKGVGQALMRAVDIGLAPTMVGGAKSAAIATAKEGFKAGAKVAGKQVLKTVLKDATIGATYGATSAISEGQKAEDVLKSAMIGGLIGVAAPPVLGTTLKFGTKFLGASGRIIAGGIEKAATKLESNLPKELIPQAGERFYQRVAQQNSIPSYTQKASEVGAKVLRYAQTVPEKLKKTLVDKFEPVAQFADKLRSAGINVPDLRELVQGARHRAFGTAKNRLDDYKMLREAYGNDWAKVKEYSHYLDDLDRLANGNKIAGGRNTEQVQADLQALFSSLPIEKQKLLQKGQQDLQKFLNDELTSAVGSGRISAEQYDAIKAKHGSYIPHDVIDYLDPELTTVPSGLGKSFQVSKSGIDKAVGSERAIDDIDTAITRRLIKNQLLNEKNKVNLAVIESVAGNEEKFGFTKLGNAQSANLTQEVKKYASADEFVKSPNIEYHFSNNPDLKTGDIIKTTHQEGVFTTKSPHTWATQLNYERGTNAPQELYITEVKNPATGNNSYTQYGHETVSPQGEVKVIGKIGNIDQMFGDRPISISEVESIKQSQLTDIWEKAQAKGATLPSDIKAVDIPKGFAKYSFFRDGVKEEWLLPEDLQRALTNFDGTGAKKLSDFLSNTVAGKIITAPARFTRAIATGRNPVFALWGNVWRDIQTVKITAEMHADDYAKGLVSALSGRDGKMADDLYRSARETGALQGGIYREYQDAEKIVAEKLNQGKVPLFNRIVDIVTGKPIEQAGQIMEEATRLGVFSRALKNGMSPQEAAKLARNATVDFSRSGTVGEVVNKVIPFLNARVQGFANLLTAIEKDPTKFVRQGMYTAAWPATVLAAHNLRYDSYGNIPENEKRKYWIIMVGQTSGKDYSGHQISIPQYIKIPKGEAQQAISNVVERVLTTGKLKYPETTNEFLKGLIRDTSPVLNSSLMPPGFGQWYELQSNYSFFREKQIEPDYTKIGNKWFVTKDIEPKYRSLTNTSVVANALGKALNWSPIKIDYVIKQGVLNDILRLGDLTAEGWVRGASGFDKASELPFARTILGTSSYGQDLRKKKIEEQKLKEKSTKRIENLLNQKKQ